MMGWMLRLRLLVVLVRFVDVLTASRMYQCLARRHPVHLGTGQVQKDETTDEEVHIYLLRRGATTRMSDCVRAGRMRDSAGPHDRFWYGV